MLAAYFIKTFIQLDFGRYHWQRQCIHIMLVLLFSLQDLYIIICAFCHSLILGGGVMEQAISVSSPNKFSVLTGLIN